MNEPRAPLVRALTELHPGARLVPLAGDASSRRFLRMFLPDGGTRVVMDYGAPFSGETDDVRLARIFGMAELPVARVLASLPEAGCLVLEDLGDVTLEAALLGSGTGRTLSRSELYRGAVALAAGVAARGTEALRRSDRASGPALDEERFRFEMRYFEENFLGRFLGRSGASPRLAMALDRLAREAASHPRVLCHRDYHSRNLMVREDGTLAMVDIQDARWGPDTYDVASLLRDAYVEIEESEVDEFLEFFRTIRPEPPDAAELSARFHLMAAQRMIKALGTFGYQIAVLGRDRYRDAVPRTLDRLRRALPSRDSTKELASAFEADAVY